MASSVTSCGRSCWDVAAPPLGARPLRRGEPCCTAHYGDVVRCRERGHSLERPTYLTRQRRAAVWQAGTACVDLRVDARVSRQRADCGASCGDMRRLGDAGVLRGERGRLESERCSVWRAGKRRSPSGGKLAPSSPTGSSFDTARSPHRERDPQGQRERRVEDDEAQREPTRRGLSFGGGRGERSLGRVRTQRHGTPTATHPRGRGRIGPARPFGAPPRTTRHAGGARQEPRRVAPPKGEASSPRRDTRRVLRGVAEASPPGSTFGWPDDDSARRGARERVRRGSHLRTRPHGSHPCRANA